MFFHSLVAEVCKATIKTDFKSIFVDDIGNGKFQQDEFEQLDVTSISKKQEEVYDDFYVDQQKELVNDQPTVKTMQFNNAIIAPSKIQSTKYQSIDPTKIDLLKISNDKQTFNPKNIKAIGFNSLGTDTVILIKGQICKAIGCTIFLANQIYSKHAHQIYTIVYDQTNQTLYSGSEGLKPEIIKWRVSKGDQLKLEYMQKVYQPKKSIGVSMIVLINENLFLTVDRFDIHKNCELYAFDRNCKKITINSKGSFKFDTKVFDFCLVKNITRNLESKYQEAVIIFVDEKGVKAMNVNQKMDGSTIEVQQLNILDKSGDYSAICSNKRNLLQQKINMIYIGTRNGSILPAFLVRNKETKQICLQKISEATVSLHKGWVFQIKSFIYSYVEQKQGTNSYRQLIFSSGAQDNTVKISTLNKIDDSSKEIRIQTLTTISLDSYAKAISFNQNKLLIGCRDAKINVYDLQISQKKTNKKIEINKINILETLCFNDSFMVPEVTGQPSDALVNQVAYNRHSKSFFLTTKFSNKMLIMGSSKNSVYNLKGKPSIIDSIEQKIIYACVEQTSGCKKKGKSRKFKANNQELAQFKTTIYIQNYIQKELELKSELKCKNITCIKFSPDGQLIAMGSNDGRITIVQFKQFKESKDIPRFVEIEQSDAHTAQVRQLIWSENADSIQSVSIGQIFFWGFDRKERKIQKVKAKKIKETQWKYQDLANLAKFSWESKQLWSQMGLVDDVNQITQIVFQSEQQQKRAIAVSMYDGKIKFYGFPSKKGKHSEVKIFDKKFRIFSQNGLLAAIRNGIGIVWQLRDQK